MLFFNKIKYTKQETGKFSDSKSGMKWGVSCWIQKINKFLQF